LLVRPATSSQKSKETKHFGRINPVGIALALKVCMRNTFTPTIALAAQLAAASFGCASIAATALSAQTTADQTVTAHKADRQLMQKIRKAVVADKTLSTEAHNINITSQDGAVTLRGTVKSDDEKKNIEDKATGIAGPGKVTSELTVAPSK
jgi:osmotically-inducible protein OsmY